METRDIAVVGLGALGSAAAYHLARRGADVVGFEQFDLGHVRGASHDTSRIIRTSYGEERYVRFAQSAYRDWADLEQVSGERLTTITGGIIMIPTAGPYAAADFTTALTATDVPFELLDAADVMRRWPQFRVGDDVETIYTADTGIAHAARTVATLQMQARAHGAELRDNTPVTRLTPGAQGVVLHTAHGDVLARKVILATDAWANRLLEPLGAGVPLQTMQEQVSYFLPRDAAAYDPSRFPVWIWEDDHCFYGFPTYGEPTIKAARDLSENLMHPDERTFVPAPELLDELRSFMGDVIPDSGEVLRTVTCQYAITPNREFIVDSVPGHPDVVVGLGAGHAFKFTPAFGRVLAELALDGESTDDLSGFRYPVAATAAP